MIAFSLPPHHLDQLLLAFELNEKDFREEKTQCESIQGLLNAMTILFHHWPVFRRTVSTVQLWTAGEKYDTDLLADGAWSRQYNTYPKGRIGVIR